jgi:peptide/nickel transport system substrate-binding protein
MKLYSSRFVALVFLLVLISLPACHKPAVVPKGGVLSYRVTTAPRSFNYILIEDESSVLIAFYLIGGRLVEFDHSLQNYKPGIAESWRRAADGRTFDVVLREGVRFSDGHSLTSDDVAFTLRALYDEKTPSPAFRDPLLIDGRPIEISVVDARRFHLKFPTPVAAPEPYIANMAVLPRHILEADFNRGAFRDAYSVGADPKTIVTAGAFKVEEVAQGGRITLGRNPYYWKKDQNGAALPYLEKILIETVRDPNNAFLQLDQGSVDIIDRLRPADVAALGGKPGKVNLVDAGAGLNTDEFWFNLTDRVSPEKRAWFNDVRFRRAISHAVDRESIARNILKGYATPLYSLVSVGNRAWVSNKLPRTDYNLDQARALLGEAGFTWRGAPGSAQCFDARGKRVEFTMLVPAESAMRQTLATALKEDLRRLGIEMKIAPIEFANMSMRIFQSLDYDAALLGATITEPDPSSYSNVLRSVSPTHPWHPNQPRPATEWEARIDELFIEQAREANPERRRELFCQIQTILAEQMPVIPIVARHISIGVNKRVKNHRPSALLPYSLWNAEELSIE